VVGMQRRGQAHVDQIDVRVVVDPVDVGGGGEPELVGNLVQLHWCASEDDDVIDMRVPVVDLGVGHAETRAQQADLHALILLRWTDGSSISFWLGRGVVHGELHEASVRADSNLAPRIPTPRRGPREGVPSAPPGAWEDCLGRRRSPELSECRRTPAMRHITAKVAPGAHGASRRRRAGRGQARPGTALRCAQEFTNVP
jgi:hypothetical protein